MSAIVLNLDLRLEQTKIYLVMSQSPMAKPLRNSWGVGWS